MDKALHDASKGLNKDVKDALLDFFSLTGIVANCFKEIHLKVYAQTSELFLACFYFALSSIRVKESSILSKCFDIFKAFMQLIKYVRSIQFTSDQL